MEYQSFVHKLKMLRTQRKVSQAELSKLLGYSSATCGHWESGRTTPNIEQLSKLSNYFDVSVDYLIGNTDNRAVSKNPNLMEIYPNEREIIRKYRAMPPTEQRMICKMLDVKHYLDDMPLERNA